MHLVQVAQRVSDLARATAFYTSLLGRSPTATFDRPGSTEWQAFIEDSEGNVVGLVEHRRPGDTAR